MLKKEFRDAALRFLETMLILLAIPVAHVTNKTIVRFGAEFHEIFEFVTAVAFIVYSVYAGMTLFQAEKKDRAFEYLFTLPLSRWDILRAKILPRLAFIGALSIASVPIFGGPTALRLAVAMPFLFAASMFLSIPVPSKIIGFIGAGMLYYLFHLMSDMIFSLMIHLWRMRILPYNPRETVSSMILSALLLLFPLGLSFWKSFKHLDLKPIRMHLKPYLAIALPSVAVYVTLVLVYFHAYLQWLYRRT